jgi:hypothetical protein
MKDIYSHLLSGSVMAEGSERLRLLRESRLPLSKNMESFDMKRLSPKVHLKVKSLLDGTFLAERYERGSVMLTSNLPFSKWELIFKDPMITAAAIDRLIHHCVILELNLPSYRLEQAQKHQNEIKEAVN